ncbi:MAG: hypothetical protein KAI66_06150 [Lentisphaeria bacterium]|nr:hypothetical protein [Lentisphaeria bacterium]
MSRHTLLSGVLRGLPSKRPCFFALLATAIVFFGACSDDNPSASDASIDAGDATDAGDVTDAGDAGEAGDAVDAGDASDAGQDSGGSPRGFEVRGMGGGGGIFVPSISPYDETFMLTACDMGGVYRSHTAGARWDLIHYQELKSTSASTHPAYFEDRVFWHVGPTLVVSRDGAETWVEVSSSPWASQEIEFLSAVPGEPDVLFVGTDTALWRSIDDASSFVSVIDERPREIVVTGERLVTISGDNTLRISTNRGETWSVQSISVNGSPLAAEEVISISGGASDANSVLFAVTSQHGTIRSTDDGTTWAIVAPFENQNTLQMAASQTRIAYAANIGGTEVWCTSDGGDSWARCFRLTGVDANVGASWVQTEIHWGYYITDHGFFASHSNPEVAVISTQGDLYMTRDGGGSWTQGINEQLGVLPGDPDPRYRSIGLEVTSSWGYLTDPHDPNREYIEYTDIGFARSVDRGETWIYGARGCDWTNTFYDVVFDPDVEGRMLVAASRRHDIPHWTNVSPNDPESTSHRGGVCISEDQGRSWTSTSSGLPELPCTTIALDPSSSPSQRTLYAGIFGEGVYKSTDGGQSWTLKSSGLGNPGNMHIYRIRRHPATGALFVLITARRLGSSFDVPGGIWRSNDNAESWTDISSSLELAWPTNLALDPADDQVLFVTAATAPGKPQGGVYRTLDGGVTWEHVLTDADVASSGGASYDHFMSVTMHPDDSSIVYAGTNAHGLWLSQNGGATWSHWQAFPFSNAQSVTVDPRDTSRIFVTTFGGGVWEGPHLP